MQNYIIIAGTVLLLVGIGLFFLNTKDSLRITETLLLLPILFLVVAGDGKLTTSFAYNRNNSFQMGNTVRKNDDPKEKSEKKSRDELILDDNTDFQTVDFLVVDESYVGLSEAITYSNNPDKLVGKTIRVRVFTLMNSPFIPKEYFGLGKYEISCCAADAGFVGYIVQADEDIQIQDNTWYEIEGVIDVGEDTYGQTVGIIRMVN